MGYRLIVTVKENPKCKVVNVGDQFIVEKGEIITSLKGKLCTYALASLIPLLTTFAVDLPADHWGNKEFSTWQCPDARGPVSFEIKREKE